jgi:acid phosphatase
LFVAEVVRLWDGPLNPNSGEFGYRRTAMTNRQGWVLIGVLVGLGLLQAQQAMVPFKAESPPLRGLDANLYMQISAEYRACCYQAYNLATMRLKERYEAMKDKEKLAVILDLDETVLDNAGFQSMLLRSGLAYDQRLWDLWEDNEGDKVGLIPGAKEFIGEARRLGVDVVYISNRSEKYRQKNLELLTRLGIGVKDPKQLKLFEKTTDKTAHRKEVESNYTVLLNIGDSLRDFDERFRSSVDNEKEKAGAGKLTAAIKDRKDKVDTAREKWGSDWIILPNPAYGEWTKALGLGRRDLDRLVGEPVKEKK